MNDDTVPCHFCGIATKMRGTRLCDNCWEMLTRMRGDLRVAWRIFWHLLKEKLSWRV